LFRIFDIIDEVLAAMLVSCLVVRIYIFPWPLYKSNPQLHVLKIVQNFSTYSRVYTVRSLSKEEN